MSSFTLSVTKNWKPGSDRISRYKPLSERMYLNVKMKTYLVCFIWVRSFCTSLQYFVVTCEWFIWTVWDINHICSFCGHGRRCQCSNGKLSAGNSLRTREYLGILYGSFVALVTTSLSGEVEAGKIPAITLARFVPLLARGNKSTLLRGTVLNPYSLVVMGV